MRDSSRAKTYCDLISNQRHRDGAAQDGATSTPQSENEHSEIAALWPWRLKKAATRGHQVVPEELQNVLLVVLHR